MHFKMVNLNRLNIFRLGKFLNETLEYLEGEDDLKGSEEYKLVEQAIASAREGLAST